MVEFAFHAQGAEGGDAYGGEVGGVAAATYGDGFHFREAIGFRHGLRAVKESFRALQSFHGREGNQRAKDRGGMVHIPARRNFFEILIHSLDALLLGEAHIHLAPSMLRHRIGYRAAADDAGIDGSAFLVVRFLLDVQDFVRQLFYRASAVLGIVSRMSAHAGDFEHVLRHPFALDDDAIIQETGFHIESHERALGLLTEIRNSVRFPMSHFLIAGKNNFDRILVIACFGEEFHGVEKDGNAALHVQHPGACDFAVGDGKRTSRRGAICENRVHVAGEDDERLRHVPFLGDEHISCLFVFVKADGKAKTCEELFDVLSHQIHAGLISRTAVPVYQRPPSLHHGGFIFIDFGEERLYILHDCLLWKSFSSRWSVVGSRGAMSA